LSGAEIGMFVVLLLLAVARFFRDLYRLFALMCLGRWENRFDRLWARLRSARWMALASGEKWPTSSASTMC